MKHSILMIAFGLLIIFVSFSEIECLTGMGCYHTFCWKYRSEVADHGNRHIRGIANFIITQQMFVCNKIAFKIRFQIVSLGVTQHSLEMIGQDVLKILSAMINCHAIYGRCNVI